MVESRSVIVSLLWVACIAGSFIFAAREVAANLMETHEHPIATSVNSIPVEVPYNTHMYSFTIRKVELCIFASLNRRLPFLP